MTKIVIEAGRKLDALVAEKVLGCKVVRYSEMSAGCDCPHFPHSADTSDELKYYSNNLAVAFEVVEKMRQDGFSFKAWQPAIGLPACDPLVQDVRGNTSIVSFVCSSGPCEKHGNPHHNHHGAYDIEEPTLELAICHAALVALKVLEAPFNQYGGGE